MEQASAALASRDWWVICLCAEWCGVCRDWRNLFEQIAAAHPQFGFAWIDIEDQAQAMGDIDVETFPTLLVAQGTTVRFFGPVQPSATQVARLLASLQTETGAANAPSEVTALLKRLAPIVLSQA